MKVHSNIIQPADLRNAVAGLSEVMLETLEVRGSRSRARCISFYLSGSGRVGGQWGNTGKTGAAPIKAATWDEWGIVIEALYRVDPDAHFGTGSYQCHEHYQWMTGHRFDTLVESEQHLKHRWDHHNPATNLPWKGSYGDEGYSEHHCRCGAISRHLTRRDTWEQAKLWLPEHTLIAPLRVVR